MNNHGELLSTRQRNFRFTFLSHLVAENEKKQVGYVVEKAGCLFLVSDRNCSGDCSVFCLVRSVLKCENVCRKFWMGDVLSSHETSTDNVHGK